MPPVVEAKPPKLPEPTFPAPLNLLIGNPGLSKPKREPKIVFYTLSAFSCHSSEKTNLVEAIDAVKQKHAGCGLEIIFCDLHQRDPKGGSTTDDWMKYPTEAYGGHELVANSLAAIARYTNQCYMIPVLVFNDALGSLLLPLSIEKQDFESLVANVSEGSPDELELLKKRYQLDAQSQPSCYRLVSDTQKV